MNTKLLKQVIKLIRAEPKRMDMSLWLSSVSGRSAPSCGTVGCIAGWTVVAAFMLKKRSIKKTIQECKQMDIWTKAARLLGIEGISGRLFLTGGWPYEFEDAYQKARTAKARVDVTIKRIEHFIKTGGDE